MGENDTYLPHVRGGADTSMSARILYAEDEEETRSIVTEELRAEGYEVDQVGDGEEAMRAL
jgi:CheY-like chemotaxis protein